VRRDVLQSYRLSAAELDRLRELSSLFLHFKAVNGAAGSALDDYQRAVIAAIACLPILNLDLDWYDGWVEVIVYPDSFVTRHEFVDEAGVVHLEPSIREGESWDRGPVILSWADLDPARRHPDDPTNLVIHEFAHKLDQLSGPANGEPPLHADMEPARWAGVFQQAYSGLQAAVDRGEEPWIDPYGAESPAEFFSVASEYFFEAPEDLIAFSPALYEQLRLFYRQDPARRYGISGLSPA
jgi:Mlc titration factor MtfA (ptsG expression regulator)